MTHRLARRDFLRMACVAPIGASLASSYARILGANERIRIGVVGFSDRAREALLPAFKAVSGDLDCEIVGVSDLWNRRREEAVAWFGREFGQEIVTWRNNDEMYAKGAVDAVIISTADFQHATHCLEAVNAGCDAYVEKPFAETMADARATLAAVRATGRIVQIGSQRRSGATYQAAFEYLRSGKFGDVVAAELTWNVNQPGRWRRPALVAGITEADVDWKRFLVNRPSVAWDARKYVEFRLFWPYSSGIPGQWMCHQIDTVHWFTGLPHPRSVSANGGIYLWKDGRTNFDTLTAVFDYGPLDDPARGFQVVFSSRFTNSAGGVKEVYYSNGGELDLESGRVGPGGGLDAGSASAMKMAPNLLEPFELARAAPAVTTANTGSDEMTNAHMRNWLECLRSRRTPNAPVDAGYQHAIACIMANAAARTGERVTFDDARQEVLTGGKVFHL